MKRLLIILLVLGLGTLIYWKVAGLVNEYDQEKKEELQRIHTKAYGAIYFKGDYALGFSIIDSLIKAYPEDGGYRVMRGHAYKEIGDTAGYVREIEAALHLGDCDTAQQLLRMGLFFKDCDHAKAETAFKRIIEYDKKGSEIELWSANYHLGQIEYKRGNFRKAVTYYNIAIKYGERDQDLYHRANAYYALGLKDSAIRDYNKSIQNVKYEFVHKYPKSYAASCDTCGFPFGSKEYGIFTETNKDILEMALQTLKTLNVANETADTLLKMRRTLKKKH